MKKRFQIWLRYFLFSGTLSLVLPGCIREDMPPCPQQTGLHLHARHSDNPTYASIGEATVYLFDHNQTYAGAHVVSRETMEREEIVYVPVAPTSRSWVAVWGNMGPALRVTIDQDNALARSYVEPIRSEDGFDAELNDLYYGIRQLSGSPVEEVILSPKTARLHVTVQGLGPVMASEYYFKVTSPYGGYYMSGQPRPGEAVMKMSGVINSYGELVSDHAYNLVHFPEIARDASVNIELWHREEAGTTDRLIASVGSAQSDFRVRPRQAETTNVLMALRSGGGLDVMVQMSKWDEVYQWNEW